MGYDVVGGLRRCRHCRHDKDRNQKQDPVHDCSSVNAEL